MNLEGAVLIHAGGLRDMVKLVGACHKYANKPKKGMIETTSTGTPFY